VKTLMALFDFLRTPKPAWAPARHRPRWHNGLVPTGIQEDHSRLMGMCIRYKMRTRTNEIIFACVEARTKAFSHSPRPHGL